MNRDWPYPPRMEVTLADKNTWVMSSQEHPGGGVTVYFTRPKGEWDAHRISIRLKRMFLVRNMLNPSSIYEHVVGRANWELGYRPGEDLAKGLGLDPAQEGE